MYLLYDFISNLKNIDGMPARLGSALRWSHTSRHGEEAYSRVSLPKPRPPAESAFVEDVSVAQRYSGYLCFVSSILRDREMSR